MRLDGRDCFGEETEIFSYKPQLCASMYGIRHSGLYYHYHEDDRKKRLDDLARKEPELAFVLACAGEAGLFEDCAEVGIWRAVCMRQPVEILNRHRNIMPGIVRKIRACPDGKEMLKEMYFSKILPVAAAMDAGETKIARCLYVQTVEELKKMAEES